MRAFARLAVMATLAAAGVALGGCETIESFTNMLDTKRKLPGERRPVFPEGVPGVHQGVPPELTRGYKEPEPPPKPPEEEQKQAVQPRPQPQRASQPRPRPAAVRQQIEPTNVPAQPVSAPPPQARAPAPASGGGMQGRWPDQQQETVQSQPQGTRSWPDQQQQQQQAPAWPGR